jgi:hypothetical protein
MSGGRVLGVVAMLALVLGRSAWAAAPATPTIAVSDLTVAAPASGTTPAMFVVTLSAATTQTVTAQYRTSDGSAVAGLDYRLVSGTVTFAPGETSRTITVQVNASPLPAPAKVFYLLLAKATNATVAQPRGTATVVDNLPVISLLDTQVAEPPAGAVDRAIFTVTLSSPSSRPVSVHFRTADGIGVAGLNYEPVQGVLTFAPGELSKTVSVTVLNDQISGPPPTFLLNLFGPTNAQIGRATGLATVNPVSVILVGYDTQILQPPPGGQDEAIFQILLTTVGPTPPPGQTLTGVPSPLPVAVDFTTINGTAVAGGDFQPVSGRLLFRPGESVKTISVPVFNDGIPSAGKAFYLGLSNPSNATIGRGIAIGTIQGTNSTITVDDTTAAASGAAGDMARFTVVLSGPTDRPVSVHYATSDGTTTAGVDYVAQSGTLVFAPGEIAKTIDVPLIGGAANSVAPGTLFIDLSDPQNGTIAKPRATATIIGKSRPGPPGTGEPVAPAGLSSAGGYWLVASDGGVFAFGDAGFFGSTGAMVLNRPIVGMAATPSGRGYWLVASDGGIFAFGDAGFFDSPAGELKTPAAAVAPTPTGNGYRLATSDGAVFTFGDAHSTGSAADTSLKHPLVGLEPTADGNGYWLATSDGAVLAFGDARFTGSGSSLALTQPIVGITAVH